LKFSELCARGHLSDYGILTKDIALVQAVHLMWSEPTDCTKALKWRDPHVIIPSTLACPFFVMYLEVSLSTFSFCVSNTYWWRTDPVDNDVIYSFVVLFPIPPTIEGNHQV